MNPLTAYLTRPATQRILRKKPGQQGFSLIELVVVIAVLAVLTAIALPNFLGVSDDAAARAAQQGVVTAFKECQVQKAKGNVSGLANFEPVELTDFVISASPVGATAVTIMAEALPSAVVASTTAAATREACFTASTVGTVISYSMNNFIAIPAQASKFPKYRVRATGDKDCVVGSLTTYEKTYNVGCSGTGGAANAYGTASGSWR